MFRVRFELMFNKSAANVFLGGDAIISVTPQTFFSRTQLQNSITIFEEKVFLEIYFFYSSMVYLLIVMILIHICGRMSLQITKWRILDINRLQA